MAGCLSCTYSGIEQLVGLHDREGSCLHSEGSFDVTCMNAPPSLPHDVIQRSFVANNGELGILPTDTEAFLQACGQDGVAVLGWEAWIVHHRWDFDARRPLPARGSWCGLFPTQSHGAVVGGSGDADATRRGIAEFVLEPSWREFVRFNITIDV
jgi:hypothetical protein